MKIEKWNGHDIRFVEKEPGDWWAIANDVAYALGYANPRDAIANHCPDVAKSDAWVKTGTRKDGTGAMRETEINIINEVDIYSLIFGAATQSKSESVKQKATEFKKWVFGVIKELRQASGLEAFQIFRMLDKEHQKEAMKRLNEALYRPVRIDFIKANTVANKAVSARHGYPKMIKKAICRLKCSLSVSRFLTIQLTLCQQMNALALAFQSAVLYTRNIAVNQPKYDPLTNALLICHNVRITLWRG